MKRVFRYCATHKEAESYLKEMCAQGWAATGVFEGLWTFEPCKPGEFTYRCASLRGKTVEQIEDMKETLAEREVEFVSRSPWWALYRSRKPFRIYRRTADARISRDNSQLYLVCLLAAVLAALAGLWLSVAVTPWFLFLPVAALCAAAAFGYRYLGYRFLAERLEEEEKNGRT